MGKQGKIIFKIFAGAILITSCTKEIHFPMPQVAGKPVINCFFTPDSIFTLYVGKSVSVNDNRPRILDDAKVYLFENDICIDTLQYGKGLYFSSRTAETGKTYNIQVQCPGFDTVYAQNRIPPAPGEISGSFRDSAFFDEEGYPVSQIKLNITDDPHQKNFYEILITTTYLNPFDSVWRRNSEVWFDENNPDPVLENEGLIPYDPSTILFSDELFNGTRYTLTINYHGIYHVIYNEIVNYPYFVVVFFRTVSEDYYLYKKQLVKHLYNQESDIFDGIGNPVQMYSNIQGGYGIFAGYAEIRDTLTKDKK